MLSSWKDDKSPNSYVNFARQRLEQRGEKSNYKKWHLPNFGVDKKQMGRNTLMRGAKVLKQIFARKRSEVTRGGVFQTTCLTICEGIYWMQNISELRAKFCH